MVEKKEEEELKVPTMVKYVPSDKQLMIEQDLV
jgi:hypothetical protein